MLVGLRQKLLERCPNCPIVLSRIRGRVLRGRHCVQNVLGTRVGTVKQKQSRALHVRQILQFSQQASLFLESGSGNALDELCVPDRHARRRELPARQHLRTKLRVPVLRGPGWWPSARTIDSSLAEISCDARMLLDRAVLELSRARFVTAGDTV